MMDQESLLALHKSFHLLIGELELQREEMAAMTRPGTGQSHNPEASSRFLTCVAGTQTLGSPADIFLRPSTGNWIGRGAAGK